MHISTISHEPRFDMLRSASKSSCCRRQSHSNIMLIAKLCSSSERYSCSQKGLRNDPYNEVAVSQRVIRICRLLKLNGEIEVAFCHDEHALIQTHLYSKVEYAYDTATWWLSGRKYNILHLLDILTRGTGYEEAKKQFLCTWLLPPPPPTTLAGIN